jgi:putative pyruvate formate lyase activating enzyme
MLQLVEHLPEGHRLVWNSNFFHSDETRALLDGVVDVWLADFKFGQDACALRLAEVKDYFSVVTDNLLAAARSGARLMVRHLLMPGHVDCCTRPVAAWLRQNLPLVEVGLTTAFLPLHRTSDHPELLGTFDAPSVASEIRREFGLREVAGTPAPASAGRGYQGTLFVAPDGSITLMDPSAGVAEWWNA